LKEKTIDHGKHGKTRKDLKSYLEALLGRPVDLVLHEPRLKAIIEQEVVYAWRSSPVKITKTPRK
jgi:predicted nucleotidyltransferase